VLTWIRRLIPAVLYERLSGLLYIGSARYCPICRRSFRRFLSAGDPPRSDAKCPACGSLERHRLIWIFFQKKTKVFAGAQQKMLHVAPERSLVPRLSRLPGLDYVTADLFGPDVSVQMDITNIKFADDIFDIIYCSHVLEHVDDDRRAIAELYRVLNPVGWAVLLVPITAEQTFEDPSITDPEERRRVFGQSDHVRRYGPDYIDRLGEAGFTVTRFRVSDLVDGEEAERMGVGKAEDIFYCTKSPTAAPA